MRKSNSVKPRFDVKPRQMVALACEVRVDLKEALEDYAAALTEHKKTKHPVTPEQVLETILEELKEEPFLKAYQAAKQGKGVVRKGAEVRPSSSVSASSEMA